MIYYREYSTYGKYVAMQGSKALSHKQYLLKGNPIREQSFIKHFKDAKKYLLPGKILCLGARTGCEVKAALVCGYPNSMGVDLHPLCDLVVKGDWHNLPVFSNTFENVYTNSLDHCLDLPKLVLEIERVLIPKGVFFFETHTNYAFDSRITGDEVFNIPELLKEESTRHKYNSMFWDSIRDIIKEFVKGDFVVLSSQLGESRSIVFLRRKGAAP